MEEKNNQISQDNNTKTEKDSKINQDSNTNTEKNKNKQRGPSE